MKKRYEEYVEGWYLWDSNEKAPMTYEEWQRFEAEKAAERAALLEAGKDITVYLPYVQLADERAKGLDPEEASRVASQVIYEMMSYHQKKWHALRVERIKSPDQAVKQKLEDDMTALYGAVEAAKLAILERYPRQSRPRPKADVVRADCGHWVSRASLMGSSRHGTACPDCYDRMSD